VADRRIQTHRKPKTGFDPNDAPLTDQQPGMRLAAGNVRNCATHAAAMVFALELEAKLSPPVQREGMFIHSSSSSHQHHKASTHFAGRDQPTSVIVADRRTMERIELRPLLSVRLCTPVQLHVNRI